MADARPAVRVSVDVTPWKGAAAVDPYAEATIVLQETAFHEGIEGAQTEGYAAVNVEGVDVFCRGWRLERETHAPFVMVSLLEVPQAGYDELVAVVGEEAIMPGSGSGTIVLAPLSFTFRYPDGTTEP